MLRTDRKAQSQSTAPKNIQHKNIQSNNVQPNNPQQDPLGLTPLPVENRQRFLRFMLSQHNDGLLPLHQISEVMCITLSDIVPVPDMPQCTVGLCSWRGTTLWLIDLAHLAGAPPLYERTEPLTTPTVIVIQSEGQSLGLVVEKVGDVDLFDHSTIHQVSGLCAPALEPFVMGYHLEDKNGASGIVLHAPSLIAASCWHSELSGTHP